MLVGAVTELLDAGIAPAELSITDIATRAGVSRPTFYKHFEDVPAAVRAATLSRLQGTFGRIPEAALGQSWTMFARDTFKVLLTDLAVDARFYLSALHGGGQAVTDDFVGFLADRLLNVSPLGPIIRRRSGPDTPEQRAQFLAAGTIWHVGRWLADTDDAARTVNVMVDRLSALLLSASGATDEEISAVRAAATTMETI